MNRNITYSLILVLGILLSRNIYGMEFSIQLQGTQNIDKDMLIKNLSISNYPSVNDGNEEIVDRLTKKGINELTLALQTFGYYQATVLYSTTTDNDKLSIVYKVTLGKPVIINVIDIEISGDGNNDPLLVKWKTDYSLKVGDILNQHKYEDNKRELLRLLYNRGFFKYHFIDRKIEVDTNTNFATIVLHLDTGLRYVYGDINFSQNRNVFNSEYLENFLTFKSGQSFLITDLITSQQHFSISDEFQSIEIEPLINKIENDAVPIDIRLNEKKPTKYELGAGYATDTGPRAFASVERRQVTRSGHRAKAKVQVSRIKSLITASYQVPLTKPYTDYLKLTGERTSEDSDTVVSQTNTVSLDMTYGLPNWLRTISLSYLFEHYELADEEVKDSKLLIPGISFEYIHDKPQDKDKTNWQFNIGFKGADTSVVSDTSFAQANMNTWLRYPLTSESRLVNYTKIGYSWTSEFKELPASQRYFTGGDYTIRGYTYNSLGPEDSDGVLIGGEQLLVTSLEYQHRIGTDLYGNLFYDIGNAFNKNDFTAKSGAGFGVGWGFPFGSLRLYAASALSKDGHPWRLHLTVGAEL